MKRIVGVVLFGLLVAGCATGKAVKSEPMGFAPVVSATPQALAPDRFGPLADRLTAVEKQQAGIEAKLDAQTAELQALRRELAESSAVSVRAQEAVKEAQLAAARAEEAAQKSTKAFELSQVKGGKR